MRCGGHDAGAATQIEDALPGAHVRRREQRPCELRRERRPQLLVAWGHPLPALVLEAREGIETAAHRWDPLIMALPGLGARSALERPDHLGRDPPAVVEPGLGLDAVIPHPAGLHPARVEGDVVLDSLIAGVGRAVAPRCVLRPPAAGRDGPVARDALPLAERGPLARLERAGRNIGRRNVVSRRARGLADAQGGGSLRDHPAPVFDPDPRGDGLDARRTREVPHGHLARPRHDDVLRSLSHDRPQPGALRGVWVRHRGQGLTPATLSRTRYTLVRAAMYSARPSSSPHAMLAASSGALIVPRCLPAGEMIHTPPGPAAYTFPR